MPHSWDLASDARGVGFEIQIGSEQIADLKALIKPGFMAPGLLFVPVAVVISAEDLQIIGGGVSTGPEGLDVIDLQIGFRTAHFSRAGVFKLAALISFENMLSHRDIDSCFCRLWSCMSFGFLLNHLVC